MEQRRRIILTTNQMTHPVFKVALLPTVAVITNSLVTTREGAEAAFEEVIEIGERGVAEGEGAVVA